MKLLEVKSYNGYGTPTSTLRRLAAERLFHIADDPVTTEGRVELLHYVREQSISRTLHRFGNVLESGPGPTR